jgi:hypothetical protein
MRCAISSALAEAMAFVPFFGTGRGAGDRHPKDMSSQDQTCKGEVLTDMEQIISPRLNPVRLEKLQSLRHNDKKDGWNHHCDRRFGEACHDDFKTLISRGICFE